MFQLSRPRFRTSGLWRGFAALAVAALTLTAPVSGQPQPPAVGPIVRIEQDWELVVSAPDAERCAPQVFVQAFPESGGPYLCQLLFNHNDQPRFAAGGLEVDIFQGDALQSAQEALPGKPIATGDGERITFTVSLRILPGESTLRLKAKNLTSSVSGSIAPDFDVTAPYTPAAFTNYQTSDSKNNSGILLGANRVTSLKITQVRKYDTDDNMVTEGGVQVYP